LNVDLLATITTAAAAIDIFGALLFVLALTRRPADVEHTVASLLCCGAGAHAIGSLVAAHTERTVALVATGAASFGFVAALPTMTHFALAYSAVRPSRRALAAVYAVAAGCALLDVFTVPHPSVATRSLGGAQRAAAIGSLGAATYCAAVAASIAVIVIVARLYLAGRKEALAVVMGATVLLATLVNDFGVMSGALTTGYLVDAGLAAFVVAIMSTRSARFTAVTLELDRRTKELRTRTSELRRSYEDLRAAQEELLKKEQLAVVGELAAVIAHEVRNPLAIIANAVAGLRKQTISRQDHETLLAILDEETSRLNRLVTDLLRYARPVNVQRSDFSLADVLDRALSLVSKDRKSIKTELKVEGHDGRIWGDPNLLRQVFDNLVVNAVQAMGAGGTLTVRVRTTTEDGVFGVAVDIIDTGEGMDSQVRTRARDPFFTTRPSGTGLGLAIVDRIVDAHGGHLAIESRAGEGTTVTVFLPESSPSEPAPPRNRPAKAPSEVPGPAGAAR
jgi:signal transduction histidine kinase